MQQINEDKRQPLNKDSAKQDTTHLNPFTDKVSTKQAIEQEQDDIDSEQQFKEAQTERD